MEIKSDTHDYAKGTRARRIVKFIFTKPVFWLLDVDLRLNPDAVIIANAKLGIRGNIVTIESGSVAILTRVTLVGADKGVCLDVEPRK